MRGGGVRESSSPQGGHTLWRAMDIVDLATSNPDGYSMRALKDITGLPQSSLYRLVQFLEIRGMLFRAYGRVYPGPALGAFANSIGAVISDVSRDKLVELSRSLGATTTLGVAGGGYGYCLLRDTSLNHVFQSVSPGARFPLTIGAIGKSLMAFSPIAAQEYAIEHSVDLVTASGRQVKRPTLYRELDSARRLGYWFSRSEVQARTVGTFAPVLAGRKAIAVIGAVTNDDTFTSRDITRMSEATVKSAQGLSQVLTKRLR